LKTYFVNAIKAYVEIIRTGVIQGTAEGDEVVFTIRGNITGDILVCISPKNSFALSGKSMLERIGSEPKLSETGRVALSLFRQKILGLTLFPKSVVWLLNILMLLIYNYYNSVRVLAFVTEKGYLVENWTAVPVVLLSAGTLIYGKTIGFKILKPVINTIVWISKQLRFIFNRKVK
jgi:hypothetical protein